MVSYRTGPRYHVEAQAVELSCASYLSRFSSTASEILPPDDKWLGSILLILNFQEFDPNVE